MLFTLKTAIELYNTYPDAWKQMVQRGMKEDFLGTHLQFNI